MKRLALVLAALLFATAAQSDGISTQNIFSDGVSGGISGVKISNSPPPCTPSAPNGQLDFSFCSDIVYVPAIIH